MPGTIQPLPGTQEMRREVLSRTSVCLEKVVPLVSLNPWSRGAVEPWSRGAVVVIVGNPHRTGWRTTKCGAVFRL